MAPTATLPTPSSLPQAPGRGNSITKIFCCKRQAGSAEKWHQVPFRALLFKTLFLHLSIITNKSRDGGVRRLLRGVSGLEDCRLHVSSSCPFFFSGGRRGRRRDGEDRKLHKHHTLISCGVDVIDCSFDADREGMRRRYRPGQLPC